MTADEQRHERVRAYLQHELSEQERKRFEQDLATDEALREALRFQRLEEEVGELLVETELRSLLAGFQASPEQPPSAHSRRNWAWVFPFLLLGGAAVYLLLRQPESVPDAPAAPQVEEPQSPALPSAPKPSQPPAQAPREPSPIVSSPARPIALHYVLDAYRLPSHLSLSLKAGQKEADTTAMSLAVQALNRGALQEAIALSSTSDSAEALDVLGHALFQNGQYAEAERAFQTLLPISPGITKDRAEWYLALCLLAQGKGSARPILLQMAAPEHYHTYQEEAAQLLGLWRE